MARYTVGFRTAGAGSTTLPVASLVPNASVDLFLVEVGVWNTTAVACNVALRRITAAGTSGAGQTAIPWNPANPAATATPKDTYTVAPTFTTGNYRFASLGAAIGSGVIWTFAGSGLRVPAGTGNGLVIVPGTGTGQILDVYMEWDE